MYIYKGEALMKQQDLEILEKHRKEKEEAASLAAAQVQTLNPKPETRNPKLEILNPKP
jgi:dihydrodipicolinate reductase